MSTTSAAIARHQQGDTLQAIAADMGITRLTLARRMRAEGYTPSATRRGHWRRGRGRNHPGPMWEAIRLAVRERLRDPTPRPDPDIPPEQRRSVRGLALWCEASPRAVARWLSGDMQPPPAAAERIRRWHRLQRGPNKHH